MVRPGDPLPAEINRVGRLVYHGEVFPPPPYPSDGQPAAEAEIFWIVRPSTGHPGTCANPATGEITIDFTGRRHRRVPSRCPSGA